MKKIIAIDRHESPEEFLARTMGVLCEQSALTCACAPLVLEKGEPPEVGTPDRTLQALLCRFLSKGGPFERVGGGDPGMHMPWYYWQPDGPGPRCRAGGRHHRGGRLSPALRIPIVNS